MKTGSLATAIHILISKRNSLTALPPQQEIQTKETMSETVRTYLKSLHEGGLHSFSHEGGTSSSHPQIVYRHRNIVHRVSNHYLANPGNITVYFTLSTIALLNFGTARLSQYVINKSDKANHPIFLRLIIRTQDVSTPL